LAVANGQKQRRFSPFVRPVLSTAPRFGREYSLDLILFCSCISTRTKVEQKDQIREATIMWLKDAVAGAGLLVFMVSSFVLASGGAHAMMAIL
jgi:hypothetical protein